MVTYSANTPVPSQPEEGRFVAKAVLAALTRPALPAPGGGIRSDPVSRLELFHPWSHLYDDSAELVSLGQGGAFPGERMGFDGHEDRACGVLVQVRPAHPDPGHFDFDFTRSRRRGLGNVHQTGVLFCVPYSSSHGFPSFSIGFWQRRLSPTYPMSDSFALPR